MANLTNSISFFKINRIMILFTSFVTLLGLSFCFLTRTLQHNHLDSLLSGFFILLMCSGFIGAILIPGRFLHFFIVGAVWMLCYLINAAHFGFSLKGLAKTSFFLTYLAIITIPASVLSEWFREEVNESHKLQAPDFALMQSGHFMRVEYENRFKDLCIFNLLHHFTSPAFQGIALFLCALIFSGEWTKHHKLLTAISSAIKCYGFMWIFQTFFTTLYLRTLRSKTILTTHAVEIRDEALYEETIYNKAFFFWPGIHKAIKRLNYIMIYVTPQSAHLIPCKAFASAGELEKFIFLLKSHGVKFD